MVTMQSADNALKSLYLGVVTDQLNYGINPFFAKIKQTTQDVWGKEVRRVVRYGISGGVGAGTETGDLPSASSNSYDQYILTLKNLYGTIEISDKAIRASENDVGAFVNLLNDEMEGLLKAATFNFGRMLFGDGTGYLATVSGDETGGVKVDSVRNFAVGMRVDFVKKDGNIDETHKDLKISDINREKKVVYFENKTINAHEADNIGHIVVQGSKGNELTGLKAIFSDTGSIYGLPRATHKWLIPYMNKNVGEISETVIQKAIDELEESTGSKVNFIICSSGVKRAYQKHLATYRRNIDVMELKGGYKALSYNGIPVISDRFCPEGTMYLLNTDDFIIHQLCDWKWLEGEDGKILKQIANKPMYNATLVKYADLLCTRPCGQAMLSGITEA